MHSFYIYCICTVHRYVCVCICRYLSVLCSQRPTLCTVIEYQCRLYEHAASKTKSVFTIQAVRQQYTLSLRSVYTVHRYSIVICLYIGMSRCYSLSTLATFLSEANDTMQHTQSKGQTVFHPSFGVRLCLLSTSFSLSFLCVCVNYLFYYTNLSGSPFDNSMNFMCFFSINLKKVDLIGGESSTELYYTSLDLLGHISQRIPIFSYFDQVYLRLGCGYIREFSIVQ